MLRKLNDVQGKRCRHVVGLGAISSVSSLLDLYGGLEEGLHRLLRLSGKLFSHGTYGVALVYMEEMLNNRKGQCRPTYVLLHKQRLGKLLKEWMECLIKGLPKRVDTILNYLPNFHKILPGHSRLFLNNYCQAWKT